MNPSLTAHLLTVSVDAYRRATQHPFLEAAGNQSLTTERLERWLAQDRIYAFVGYPKFVALLISHIPLSTSAPSDFSGPATLEERILSLLSFSLTNIVQEIDLFKKTARENGLDIMKRPRADLTVDSKELTGSVTKAYTDFMIATAATGTLSEGLVLLWATEKCYLEAWTYARSHMPGNKALNVEPGTTKALETFIHNWTTDDFRGFVDQIGALVDEHAATASPKEFDELKSKAEEIWKWCLWYEERFWDGE